MIGCEGVMTVSVEGEAVGNVLINNIPFLQSLR